MSRPRKIKSPLKVEEIDARIKETVGFWRVRRWMIIRQAVTSDASAKELADRFGMSRQTVLHLLSAYHHHGADGVEAKGRGQRQKAYLGLEEEADFLKPFQEKANSGHIATIQEIHDALEKHVGHKVHVATTYRLLHRHDWRKLSPRPSHIKSDRVAQEAFKKTSNKTSKK
jgi:transposase